MFMQVFIGIFWLFDKHLGLYGDQGLSLLNAEILLDILSGFSNNL